MNSLPHDLVTVEEVANAIAVLRNQGSDALELRDIRDVIGRGRLLDIARLRPQAEALLEGDDVPLGAAATKVPAELQGVVDTLWRDLLDAARSVDAGKSQTSAERAGEMVSMGAELQRLRNELASNEKALSLTKANLRDETQKNKQLQERIDSDQRARKTREQNERIAAEQHTLSLHKAEENADRLDKELDEAHTEVDRLRRELNEQELKIRREGEQSREDLEALRRDNTRLQTDLENLIAIRDQQQSSLQALDRDNDRLRQQLATENQTQERAMSLQQDKVQLLERQVEQMRSALSRSDALIDQLRSPN